MYLSSGSDRLYIEELIVKPDSNLVNKTIGQLEINGKGTFLIVALRRQNQTIIKNPDRSLVLQSGDTVIVIGHEGDIPQFIRFNEMKSKMRYRGSSVGEY